VQLRVTTFNANNQIGARAYLERRIATDIALLQEVARSAWPNAFIPVPTLDGRSKQSATGIDPGAWQLEPLPPNSLGVSAPKGTVTAATLRGPSDLRCTMVSVYAQINNGLAYPTARAIVDDLEPLLCSGAAERLLLGGDFNAWDQFERSSSDRKARQIWQDMWNRLDHMGLVNLIHATRSTRPRLEWCACGQGDDCWHAPTVRRMRVNQPAHCDYLFASEWFASRLTKCEIVDIMDPELLSASDHAPVTATFDLADTGGGRH
jgi:endonuclease/exonuclease/phosphatase family metal-dependent hydrolase